MNIVINMNHMFAGSTLFNADISSWTVNKVCLRLLPPHILYITYSLHCLYTDSLVVNTHLNYSHTQSSSAIVLAVPQGRLI